MPFNKNRDIFGYNSKLLHYAITYSIIDIDIVGVLLWLVNTYIPMDSKIKNILNIVVVICVIIWLLKVFGLFNGLMDVQA